MHESTGICRFEFLNKLDATQIIQNFDDKHAKSHGCFYQNL